VARVERALAQAVEETREDIGFALFFAASRTYVHDGSGSVRWFDSRADAYAFRHASVAQGASVWIVPHPSRGLPMFSKKTPAPVSPPRDASVKPYAPLRYPAHGFGGKKRPR